jgi:DNA-binding transcriptional MerR regulator
MSEAAAASPAQMTIDELSRAAGMTVRNIRAHQTRGLLPAPHLEGRTGYYGAEHLARLRLIVEMQGAGFTLASIKTMLDRVPAGAGEEALLFERALLAPWGTDEPEIVSFDELRTRFGEPTPELLGRAVELGVVRPLDDGSYEIPSPGLLRAGEKVVALGVPVAPLLEVVAVMLSSSRHVAEAFSNLFLDHVWRPFEAAGRDPEHWPEVRAALEQLRGVATDALLATFQSTMAASVEEAFGSLLESDDLDAGRAAG